MLTVIKGARVLTLDCNDTEYAQADIVIREKKEVLVFPERLVTFEGEKATVEIPPADPKEEPTKREIRVGLSDGLSIEVLDGLKQGEMVVERPPKEITAG